MQDLISRQAAIDALRDWEMCYDWDEHCREEPKEPWIVSPSDVVNKLPPAQPRGKWIYHIDDLFPAESTKECDQCHAEQPLICDDEFCPHCGAKMEVTE